MPFATNNGNLALTSAGYVGRKLKTVAELLLLISVIAYML